MSYPTQPSFTPPYGQPQPPRQTNLWAVGTAVIAVLIVIMTVTLLIIQRTNDSVGAGGGSDPTTDAEPSAEEPTAEEPTEEEPTEEEPSEDPAETEDAPDGEAHGFKEATCDAFDVAGLEEVFGNEYDPDENYTSSSSSGDTGSLTCGFYTTRADSVTTYMSSYGDADYALEYLEDDRDYWDDEEDYHVTDYAEFGDAGYHVVFGEKDEYQKREIHIVVGALDIKVSVWVYPDDVDIDQADALLTDIAKQSAELLGEYA